MLQGMEDCTVKTTEIYSKKSLIVHTRTCEGVHSCLAYTWQMVFRSCDYSFPHFVPVYTTVYTCVSSYSEFTYSLAGKTNVKLGDSFHIGCRGWLLFVYCPQLIVTEPLPKHTWRSKFN